MQDKSSIVIVGGGLTGIALALTLAKSFYSVAIIEAVDNRQRLKFDYDARPIALSRGTVCLMHQYDLWSGLQQFGTPINQVHVSEKGGFGFTRFDAKKHHVPELGNVIEMPYLMKGLLDKLSECAHVKYYCPATLVSADELSDGWQLHLNTPEGEKTIETHLLVAADGENSVLRARFGIEASVHDYDQQALVANIGLTRSHKGVAYERFTQTGAIAMLPMTDNRSGLVLTDKTEKIEKIAELSENHLLNELQNLFGYRLGRFAKIGIRKNYSLRSIVANKQITHHAVLLGNSAHTQLPIAAQGFNLSFRDIITLSELLIEASRKEQNPGEERLLTRYLEQRVKDQKKTMTFTHQLSTTFGNQLPFASLIRNLGMTGLDLLPLGKGWLGRRLMGLS